MSFTVPLPPRTQLYNRSCSNKHTHIYIDVSVSPVCPGSEFISEKEIAISRKKIAIS
jgi:hypothetical protein